MTIGYRKLDGQFSTLKQGLLGLVIRECSVVVTRLFWEQTLGVQFFSLAPKLLSYNIKMEEIKWENV